MDKKNNHKSKEIGNDVSQIMIHNQSIVEENVPCNTPKNYVHSTFGGSSDRIVACVAGCEGPSVSPTEYVSDPGSILSLQPWIFRKSGSQNGSGAMSGTRAVGKGKNLLDGFQDVAAVEVSARSPGLGSGPGRGCGALRSRRTRRNFIKPLVEMENPYIPQLYGEDFEIEECTFAPVPSPASARPFVVTDGRRIISKSYYEPVAVPLNTRFDEEYMNNSRMPGDVIGMAPLPELKKMKKEGRESYCLRLGLSDSRRRSKPSGQSGLRDRILILSAGLCIGFITSSLSNKKELDTLKGSLRRMENLVQDLQDELEMKEGLTVNELPNESFGEHEDDNKADVVDSESMSKIEAELEAELARLELNITSKLQEEEKSDFNEADLEFIGEVVQGDLNVGMVRRDPMDYSTESDHGRDSRESSPGYTYGSNYPVSPRDLSIRLHKVIQHRLENRVKELESALAQRHEQAQPQMMADERICSGCGSGTSSNQESPLFIQETSCFAEPYCLNLSGDALEAYDEAYEEFMRIADSPCTTSTNGKPQVSEEYLLDRSLIWGIEEDSTGKLKEAHAWEGILKNADPSRAQERDGDCEDDSDDDDHDSEALIQQIVERTKQGSPVLMNAQKLLLSVDQ